jgi:HSP20 family protein
VDKQKDNNLSVGIPAVFGGFIDLIQIAVEIVAKSPADTLSRGRRRITEGIHAIYGVSLRVSAQGAMIASFGNVRQNERKEPVIDEARAPMVDILDQDDHYLVIAELPGVGSAAVDWNIRDNQLLVIRAESGDRMYYGEVQLADSVQQQATASRCENGVLQLTLWKQQHPRTKG